MRFWYLFGHEQFWYNGSSSSSSILVLIFGLGSKLVFVVGNFSVSPISAEEKNKRSRACLVDEIGIFLSFFFLLLRENRSFVLAAACYYLVGRARHPFPLPTVTTRPSIVLYGSPSNHWLSLVTPLYSVLVPVPQWMEDFGLVVGIKVTRCYKSFQYFW